MGINRRDRMVRIQGPHTSGSVYSLEGNIRKKNYECNIHFFNFYINVDFKNTDVTKTIKGKTHTSLNHRFLSPVKRITLTYRTRLVLSKPNDKPCAALPLCVTCHDLIFIYFLCATLLF